MERQARPADVCTGPATSEEVKTSMSDPEADTIVPKDELLAALAEIEKMSGKEPSSTPNLDDGRRVADKPVAADPPAPEPHPATPAVEDTPTRETDDLPGNETEINAALDRLEALTVEVEASAGDSETSAAMPPAKAATPAPSKPGSGGGPREAGGASSSRASPGDEQLRAASAEVERVGTKPKQALRRRGAPLEDDYGADPRAEKSSVGAGVSPAVGPDKLPPAEQAKSPAVPELRGDDKPEEAASTAAAPSKRKRFCFKIGRPSADEDVAGYEPPDERGEAAATGRAAPPVTPLSKRLYRAIDRALDALNRPFAGLSNSQRALVGWVALTTLIVSILAIILMPIVLPHRDAITFLEEKRAQLDMPAGAAADDVREAGD
jgi:hypothetical protein